MSASTLPTIRPISPDWTARQFMESLAEDDAIDAASLDLLVAVEAGLIERSAPGSPALPWLQAPGAVAVIRSIARLMRADPALRSMTLGELLSPGRNHPFSSKPSAVVAPNRVDSTRRGGFDETSTTSATTREKQMVAAS